MTRKALGRGLEALIPRPEPADTATGVGPEGQTSGPLTVSLERIRTNPYQPRTVFDEVALADLETSIRENGLIQPLIVRPVEGGYFDLIAGERRFLACRRAGMTEVPVVLRQASRREMLEVALVENLQREDLNPMEEAEAYQRLATEFGLTQEEIAHRVGKSRSTVTNALRLLTLEQDLRDMVSRGTLTSGHARALLAVPDSATRHKLAREVEEKGLSVRQVETLTAPGGTSKRPTARRRSHPALETWEERLRDRFGTQVRIVGGLARGRIEIHYFNEEDLERVLALAGTATEL